MQPTCTHIALLCHDVEASVAFYKAYVELIEVHRRVDHGVTVVWMGEASRPRAFVLVLIAADHNNVPDPAPVAHLGYAVQSREDVDRMAAKGRARGIQVHGPVEAGPIVGYFCLLRDPDGNQIEFSYGQSLGHDVVD